MKEITPAALFIILIIMISSCGNRKMSPAEFARWVESPENGLRQSLKVDSILFTLQYKPPFYKTPRNTGCETAGDNKNERNYNDYDHLLYFELRIRKSPRLEKNINVQLNQINGMTPSAYFELFLSKSIALKQNNDTVCCSMFHHEADGGLRPFYNMLVAFEKTTLTDTSDLEFIVNDKVIVNHPFSFVIKAKNLKNIPSINI